MDTNRDSVHQSQNKDNFPTFSLGLEFLNEAEREKNNGKGDSASEPSRFASLSEREMQQIWQKDTLVKPNKRKTGLKVFRFEIVKLKLELSTEKLK